MIVRLPIPEREIGFTADWRPNHETPQTPDRLGNRAFKTRSLVLRGSDVRAWQGRFHEVPYLRSLDISWSAAILLPDDIKRLRHLRTLLILNVNLFEFPQWICEMTQLEKLTVRGTNIIRVPEEITRLTNLRELELGNNLLTGFDVDLRRCRKLRRLSISDNDLQRLPSKLPPKTRIGLAGTPFRTYTGFRFKDLPSEEK